MSIKVNKFLMLSHENNCYVGFLFSIKLTRFPSGKPRQTKHTCMNFHNTPIGGHFKFIQSKPESPKIRESRTAEFSLNTTVWQLKWRDCFILCKALQRSSGIWIDFVQQRIAHGENRLTLIPHNSNAFNL